jgi:glycosyltransferase involved in cell wall biosynthesis
MKQLAISIVMPLYNKETDVNRSIASVLKQTVSDFEIIVINDGSTDKGPKIVRSIDDHRIRVVDQKNAGVSVARNRGIHESRADLIAFLDADDEWKPTFLETILNLKDKYPTCNVFATNYIYREVNGKYRLPIIRGIPLHPWDGIIDNYFDVAIKSDPPLWTSAVAVTKEAIRSVGLFPAGVTSGEDLLTWTKLALKYNIAYTTKACAFHYTPRNVFERPGRFKKNFDFVGQELICLLSEVEPSEAEVLKKFIALWHKNRTVTFLDLGENKKAIQELQLMAYFSKKSIKWYCYTFLANLPKNLTQLFLRGIKSLGRIRRRAISQSFLKNSL